MPSKKGKKNATSADATSRHVSQGGKIITSPTAAEEQQQQQPSSASTTPLHVLPRPTLPRQGTHSLTPSPLRSGVSYRSIGPASSSSSASGGLAPARPARSVAQVVMAVVMSPARVPATKLPLRLRLLTFGAFSP